MTAITGSEIIVSDHAGKGKESDENKKKADSSSSSSSSSIQRSSSRNASSKYDFVKICEGVLLRGVLVKFRPVGSSQALHKFVERLGARKLSKGTSALRVGLGRVWELAGGGEEVFHDNVSLESSEESLLPLLLGVTSPERGSGLYKV